MKNIAHYFFPHKANNHQPYLTRHPALASLLLLLMTVQTSLNIFYSSRPQVLGFATSIYQQEIIDLTNAQRQQQGLGGLKHNPKLDEAAKLKAMDMFAKNYWAHISPDGIDPWHWFQVVSYGYLSAGENLAQGFDTSNGVVNAWMASPSHKENILYNKFTEIGVAIVNGTLQGEETTLVVQLFGLPQGSNAKLAVNPQPANPTAKPTAKPPTVIPTTQPTLTTIPSPLPTEVLPSETPTPTLVPDFAQEDGQSDGQKTVLGPAAGFTNQPPSRVSMVLSMLSDHRNLSISRLLTIFMLVGLITLFAIDSFIIWHRRVGRQNAHRFVYASILVLALINTIYTSAGTIL